VLVDLFKKSFRIIRNMFTEDNLATAQIAQLFGSELLKVQQSATTDSGNQPNIVNINPKQFLTNAPQYQAQKKAEEQRLFQMLQREAEAACPLPHQTIQPIQQNPQALEPVTITQIPSARTSQQNYVPSPDSSNCWERIAVSLERIANKLEGVDIAVKKKRIKRASK